MRHGPLSSSDVEGALRRLPNGGTLVGRREVKELPSILWEDEQIHDIVQGFYGRGSGILVLTQRRLIFVDKGVLGGLKVEDFPLDKVSTIQYSTGLLLGTITIFTSGNKAEISNVPKASTRSFAEGARALIARLAEKPHSPVPAAARAAHTPVAASASLSAEIEKLVALKNSGLLTDEEFTAAKRKLLS